MQERAHALSRAQALSHARTCTYCIFEPHGALIFYFNNNNSGGTLMVTNKQV